jgi:trigger factor
VAVKQEITRLDNSAVRLNFTCTNEDLRGKYNKIVGDFAKDFQIKGFRRGKAPISVVENKLGKALREDALNAIIGNTVREAIESEDFPSDAVPLPYSEPEVEGSPELDLSRDLVFSVKYDVMPKIQLQKWEGLEIEVETANVSSDDVNRELEEIRERNAIIMDKEDGAAAEKGDVATVNYSELAENGEEIAGTKREDFTFVIGTGHNIFKFDDEITGMKKGETREIQKSYPEDFSDKDLAGQTKKIRVTLTALKQKELPEDDELAQDVSENFKNIDDLRRNIEERLAARLETGLKNLKKKRIIDKIIELNPVDIPQSMINIEGVGLMRQTLRNYSVPDEILLKIMSGSGGDEARKHAAKNALSKLIIGQLIKDLNIDASDDDIEEMYGVISSDMGIPVESVKEEVTAMEGGGREFISAEVKQKKVFDILIEKNTIKTGKKVNFLDIFQKTY